MVFYQNKFLECSSDQFKCDAICLSVILRCNGQIDCESGEDETDCDEYGMQNVEIKSRNPLLARRHKRNIVVQ